LKLEKKEKQILGFSKGVKIKVNMINHYLPNDQGEKKVGPKSKRNFQ
jgi:hypothetical protein